MNTLFSILVVVAGLVGNTISQEESCNSYEDGAYRSAAMGAQTFAKELYQVVSSAEGNLVVAPLSVALLLALLRMGAGKAGPTALQLTDALHLGQDTFLVGAGYRTMVDNIASFSNTSDDDVTLLLANRMFVQSEYNIEETFQEIAENDFRSGVQELDFADSENSTDVINEWVEDNTMGKITDLIPEGFLTSDTRLVLVNAIYFYGAWDNPFDEENTRDETFHISDSEEVTVPMMHGSFRIQYGAATNADATIIRLPYRSADERAYMVIVLPNDVNGLSEIEKNLAQLAVTYEMREVQITLPKFEFDYSSQLNEDLMKMGITEIFGNEANLQGISDDQLYVSQILQKAYVSVNENGTEAAAATAIIINRLTSVVIESSPVEFKADHPFIFLLRNEDYIFFIGRVHNPQI